MRKSGPDFEQAIVRSARRLGVSEQFVEKDYYITEVLRIAVDRLGDKAIFKGGTSLSKGWGLIHRFSEDIDLFVNPDAFANVKRKGDHFDGVKGDHPGSC